MRVRANQHILRVPCWQVQFATSILFKSSGVARSGPSPGASVLEVFVSAAYFTTSVSLWEAEAPGPVAVNVKL
jgi:hypothetical protein